MVKTTIFHVEIDHLWIPQPPCRVPRCHLPSRPMAIGSGSATGNGAGTWGVGSAACTGDQGGMDLSRGFRR